MTNYEKTKVMDKQLLLLHTSLAKSVKTEIDISLTDDEIVGQEMVKNGKVVIQRCIIQICMDCKIVSFIHIASPLIIREYNEKCQVNLPEYKNITCSF